MRVIYLFPILICGCVPYQQQQINHQNEIDDTYRKFVQKANPNKLIFNSLAYQNQIEFENTNIENNNEITINSLLPKKDLEGVLTINLIDDHLLIPVHTIKEMHEQCEYFLIFDENYSMDENFNIHVSLIFVESRPEQIIWQNTREIKRQETKYYTFNLLSLQHPDTNKIFVHIFGRNVPLEYIYQ
jgi:hypothetical protein